MKIQQNNYKSDKYTTVNYIMGPGAYTMKPVWLALAGKYQFRLHHYLYNYCTLKFISYEWRGGLVKDQSLLTEKVDDQHHGTKKAWLIEILDLSTRN